MIKECLITGRGWSRGCLSNVASHDFRERRARRRSGWLRLVLEMHPDVPRSCLADFFTKSFYNSQFPHKFVNSSFILTKIKKKMKEVCGNWLL